MRSGRSRLDAASARSSSGPAASGSSFPRCAPTIRTRSPATSSRSSAAAPCFSTCTTSGLLEGRTRCTCRTSTPTSSAATAWFATPWRRSSASCGRCEAGHHARGPRAFLRGARRALQPARGARSTPARNPDERLHAGAGGDADLSQSHRLQRPLPASIARGEFNVPGRTLRIRPHLRHATTSGGLAAALGQPGTVARGRARSTRPLADGGAGRFRLPRSAVRAGEPTAHFTSYTVGRLRRADEQAQLQRAVIAPRGARRARRCSAIPCRSGHQRAVRARTPRRAAPGCGREPSRRGGPSTRARRAAGRRARIPDHERPARDGMTHVAQGRVNGLHRHSGRPGSERSDGTAEPGSVQCVAPPATVIN